MNKKRKKFTKLGRRLCYLVLFFSLILLGLSLYDIYGHYVSYKEGETTYEEISEKKEEPTLEVNKHDLLLLTNKDYVGWLKLEDSVIDYPIVQGEDNEYYLEHLFDGKKNHMGCIFMDYENNKAFTDKNTFLYGHHTNTGMMFCSLEKYKDQNYYNSHKEFSLETKDASYSVKPFAGLLLKSTDPFIQLDFDSNEAFMDYVREIRTESIFESPVTIKPSDKLLTMVTCTDDFYDARLAIFCVIEES